MTPTDDELRILIIGKWLAKFAAIYSLYGKTLKDHPEKFDEFEECFKSTAPADLEYAFERTRKEYAGPEFPSPAEVMKRLKAREVEVESFEAEKAWDELRWLLRTFYQDEQGWIPFFITSLHASRQFKPYWHLVETQDFGDVWRITPKPFSRQVSHAIERVGGLDRIRCLEGSEHDFVKKDWLQCHRRFSETAGYLAPSKEEAKQLMEGLKKGLNAAPDS